MTENYVQVPNDSTGKKVATSEVTNRTGNVVELQQVVIGDPINDGSLASVNVSHGLQVMITNLDHTMKQQNAILQAILMQLSSMQGRYIDPSKFMEQVS